MEDTYEDSSAFEEQEKIAKSLQLQNFQEYGRTERFIYNEDWIITNSPIAYYPDRSLAPFRWVSQLVEWPIGTENAHEDPVFRHFPQLSTELRRQVWEHTLPASRIILISSSMIKSNVFPSLLEITSDFSIIEYPENPLPTYHQRLHRDRYRRNVHAMTSECISLAETIQKDYFPILITQLKGVKTMISVLTVKHPVHEHKGKDVLVEHERVSLVPREPKYSSVAFLLANLETLRQVGFTFPTLRLQRSVI
ncbi:hypothetical protein G7Y89_g1314 [Cudoniella acicularis]|uniref:2EXR domain-containing protein n=1 Tax=Cudoniella acicularis TaxID=354080 RepID=A0A8H4W7I6_9HELO|nr:hypothetical protein G7Y89_g1314 [Cudoniella acicularis]